MQAEQITKATFAENLGIKEISGGFNSAEITVLEEALLTEGGCYLRNHVLMLLLGSGCKEKGVGTEKEQAAVNVIRKWHEQVTKKNLHRLYELAREIGIPLPFKKPLQERKQEIINAMNNVGVVLTDHESLKEVCFSAQEAIHIYAAGSFNATNPSARDTFKTLGKNVCEHLDIVKDALLNTGAPPPLPFVKQVLVQETGVRSHTTTGKEESGMGGFEPSKWVHQLAQNIASKMKFGKPEESGKTLVSKEIKTDLTTAEITAIQLALFAEGRCVIKNTVLRQLLGEPREVIEFWTKNVTKKNLDALYQLSRETNLPLPFVEPLEVREQQITSKIQAIRPGKIITELELLKDLKIGACQMAHCYVQAALVSTNKQVTTVFQTLAANVCNNIPKIKDAIAKAGDALVFPLVKQVSVFETGVTVPQQQPSGDTFGTGIQGKESVPTSPKQQLFQTTPQIHHGHKTQPMKGVEQGLGMQGQSAPMQTDPDVEDIQR